MYGTSNIINFIIRCCFTDKINKNVIKKILKIIDKNISIKNRNELRREL